MYFIIMIILLFASYFLIGKFPFIYIKLIILNIIATLGYIFYRFFTIPTNSFLNFIMGILLFLSEALVFFSFFNFEVLFLCKKYKKNKAAFDSNYFPHIDIFICTYNEPVSIVKKTILACKNLDYPKNLLHIYLCDDGHRKKMKELCKNSSISYLSRKECVGAKAGNLNYALSQTSSELFAVFDADMIPKKEFLNETIGYFKNKKLAFVQTPQIYYNKDIYQRNLGCHIPNEQDFFMREIQTARDSINAALHVGTNVIFQRKAVEEIGGYPTCSITEDMALGILLQNKGYQTKFLNKELVLGLSAATYRDLVKQRDRWCRGNLQVTKRYNPLKMKGLSFLQKLIYIDGTVYWLTSIAKILFLISPLFYLLFGVYSVDIQIEKFFSFFIPVFISQFFVFRFTISNTRTVKWSHYYETAMAPHICCSIIKELFRSKTIFFVTPKEKKEHKNYFQWEVVSFHIFVTFITIFAWVFSFYKLIQGQLLLFPFLINFFWTIYNIAALFICIRVAYHKTNQKEDSSIRLEKEIFIQLIKHKKPIWIPVQLSCLSDSYIEFHIKEELFSQEYFLTGKMIPLKIDEKVLYGIIKKVKNPQKIITVQFIHQSSAKLESMLPVIDLYTQHLKPFFVSSAESL